MALTKEVVNDKIEIVGENRVMQIRTATIIKEDGVVISKSYHREVLTPGRNIDSMDDEIKNICNVVWTGAVKAKNAAMIANK